MIDVESITGITRRIMPPVVPVASVSNMSFQGTLKNPALMTIALVTMDNFMLLFTEQANTKFAEMSLKAAVSRDAQEMADYVDVVLSRLDTAQDSAELPPAVIAYLRANNIQVNEKSIDQFLAQNGGKLDKADLSAVKATLESTAGRAADFVQQNQLKLQQLMQNFNAAVAMTNSLQTMTAESIKSIVQAIR